MFKMKINHVYEAPEPEDGYRMLVDKLWPRGLKKEVAALDEWNKDITPSTELRKWFGHKPENFERFGNLYQLELSAKTDELKRLLTLAEQQNLTLLYAAKSKEINHARILLDVLMQLI